MLSRLQHWFDGLEEQLNRVSLRRALPVFNVTLVLLVLIGISLSAMGLLRKLANEQGIADVQLAGSNAREALRRMHEDLLTQAHNLGANAALRRVAQESAADLPLVLRRVCQAAALDECVLLRGTQVLAYALPADVESATFDWAKLDAAAAQQGERFAGAFANNLPPMLGAGALLLAGGAPPDDVRVLVMRNLDGKLATSLSERADMQVRFINYGAYDKDTADVYARLYSSAVSDGRYAAMRINDDELFAAAVPIFASTGEVTALIQVTQSTTDSDADASQLTRRLLLIAVIVGAIAVAASLLLAQLLIAPIQSLTDAAARLAQGDFSTSIPGGGAQEVAVLSRTMEDMRRNLVALTGALRQREAEAQAVLQGTIEGVFAVDKARKLTYLNPQAAKLLSMSSDAALGQFCGDVLKPGVDQFGNRPCDTHCPILTARNAGQAQAMEVLQSSRGDTKRVVITSAALVEGRQVQVLRDETEAEAIRYARDAVLANISHEFRTPLAAQLASIELLLDGLQQLPYQQARELVVSLQRSTLRLTALIDNLLESVRIESGQLSIRQQSVALAEVIEEAQAVVSSLLAQREQQLHITVADDLPRVNGDAVRLTQVLVNLLANANKYAPEQSDIYVGAQVQGDWVRVWVEDQGPGISDAQQTAIFQRFARGAGREPEPGGLGLGLWIVKSIVERHGGHIQVERTAQQRTRFGFTLPLSPAAQIQCAD